MSNDEERTIFSFSHDLPDSLETQWRMSNIVKMLQVQLSTADRQILELKGEIEQLKSNVPTIEKKVFSFSNTEVPKGLFAFNHDVPREKQQEIVKESTIQMLRVQLHTADQQISVLKDEIGKLKSSSSTNEKTDFSFSNAAPERLFSFSHDAPREQQQGIIRENTIKMLQVQRNTSDQKVKELEAEMEKQKTAMEQQETAMEQQETEHQATLATAERAWVLIQEHVVANKAIVTGAVQDRDRHKAKYIEREKSNAEHMVTLDKLFDDLSKGTIRGIRKFEEKLEAKNKECVEVNEALTKLKEEIQATSGLKQQLTSAQEDAHELDGKVQTLDKKNKKLKVKLEVKNKECIEANEELKELKGEMEATSGLKQQLTSAQEDAYELDGKVQTLDKENRDKERQIREQKAQLDKDQTALKNLEEKIVKTEKLVEDRGATIKRQQDEINVLKAEVREKNQDLTSARKTAEKQLKDKEIAHHSEIALRDQIATLLEQNQQLSAVEEVNQRLTTDIETLAAEVQQLVSLNQELEGLRHVAAPTNDELDDGEDHRDDTVPLSAHPGGLGFENLDQDSSGSGSDGERPAGLSRKRSTRGKGKATHQSTQTEIPNIVEIAPEIPQLAPVAPRQTLTLSAIYDVANISPVAEIAPVASRQPLTLSGIHEVANMSPVASHQPLTLTGIYEVANISPEVPRVLTPTLVQTQTPIVPIVNVAPLDATPEPSILLGTGFPAPVEPQPLNETPRPPQKLADLADIDFTQLGGRPAPPTDVHQTQVGSQIGTQVGKEDYVMIPTDVHRSFNPLRWWLTVYYELFWVPFTRWINIVLPESWQLPSRRLNMSGGRNGPRRPVHYRDVGDLFQIDDPTHPSGLYLAAFEAPSTGANIIMLFIHLAIYLILWNAWEILNQRNLWLGANELTRQYVNSHRRENPALIDYGLVGYFPFSFGLSLDGLRYSLHTWANIDRSFPG